MEKRIQGIKPTTARTLCDLGTTKSKGIYARHEHEEGNSVCEALSFFLSASIEYVCCGILQPKSAIKWNWNNHTLHQNRKKMDRSKETGLHFCTMIFGNRRIAQSPMINSP
jgi:hypothetical protein